MGFVHSCGGCVFLKKAFREHVVLCDFAGVFKWYRLQIHFIKSYLSLLKFNKWRLSDCNSYSKKDKIEVLTLRGKKCDKILC